MLNVEVYDADVHDFYIQHSLIDIRYLVVVKTEILPDFMYRSCTRRRTLLHSIFVNQYSIFRRR
jgi:hypothetical protein